MYVDLGLCPTRCLNDDTRMSVVQTETAVLEASAKQLKALRQGLATETSIFRAQIQRTQASTQEVRDTVLTSSTFECTPTHLHAGAHVAGTDECNV